MIDFQKYPQVYVRILKFHFRWLTQWEPPPQFGTVTEPEKESHFRHFQTGDQNYDESCHRMVYY